MNSQVRGHQGKDEDLSLTPGLLTFPTFPLRVSNDGFNAQGCRWSQTSSTMLLRESGSKPPSPSGQSGNSNSFPNFILTKLIKPLTPYILTWHDYTFSGYRSIWMLGSNYQKMFHFTFQSGKPDTHFVHIILGCSKTSFRFSHTLI